MRILWVIAASGYPRMNDKLGQKMFLVMGFKVSRRSLPQSFGFLGARCTEKLGLLSYREAQGSLMSSSRKFSPPILNYYLSRLALSRLFACRQGVEQVFLGHWCRVAGSSRDFSFFFCSSSPLPFVGAFSSALFPRDLILFRSEVIFAH